MRKWVVWRNGRILGLLLVLLLGLQPAVIALSPVPEAPAQEPAPTDDVPDAVTPTPDEGSGGTVVTVPQRATPTPTSVPDVLDDTAVITQPTSITGAPPGWFTNRDCSQPLRVMPLGNSITAGRGSGTPPNQNTNEFLTGYRYPLYLLLTDAAYQFDFVGRRTDGIASGFSFDYHNQGTPGQRIDQMNGLIDEYLVDNPPDLILLHIGTNDVLQTDSSNVSNLDILLDNIDAFNEDIPIIVARIINEQELDDEHDHVAIITAFNNNLQTLVNGRIADGDLLTVVDMEPVLDYSESSPDFYDQWHPNTTGYGKMAPVWFNKMQEIWPTCFEITTTPVTTATATENYTYDVDAFADPEPAQPITYSLVQSPAGMTINSTTGVISWTPIVAQVGPKQVEVRATNGSQTTSQPFTIFVEAEYEIYLPMIVR